MTSRLMQHSKRLHLRWSPEIPFMERSPRNIGLSPAILIKTRRARSEKTWRSGKLSMVIRSVTVICADLNQGSFTFINLKEGVYKVWIKANAPYKDATIENVAVKDSSTTDLGEIKLQQ